MAELISVLTKGEIKEHVARVAKNISCDYQNGELVLIGVLKGAFIFLSDLAREITVPVKIDFVEASSYGAGTSSSGRVRITKEIEIDITGKDVLLVEDIVDTGLTLTVLIEYIKSLKPKTVKVCTLLSKCARRKVKIHIDYACHEIQNGYVVGYGLDHAGDYRHLPQLYELKL
ncbi:MAG: hypoxanthine phosphoribosyltransferase [Thermodesulfobacteriota bacterium]